MSFRLPRRAAWAVARVLLSMGVASAALIRIQPVTAAPPPAVAPSGDASAAASSLTQRILGDNPDDAANAVSEVFAWTGLATRDGVSEVRSAVAPTIPVYVLTSEARVLAEDASLRASGDGQITLADLGTYLAQLGFPFKAGQQPGQVVVQVLARAIDQAQADPSSAHSFVPLFLLDMARAGNAQVDLTSDTTDPSTVTWSLMEAQLFLADSLRADSSYPDSLYYHAQADTGMLGLTAASVAHAADTPCSDFENNLGIPALKSMHGVALDKWSSEPINAAWSALGYAQDSAMRATVGRALAVLKMAAPTASPNIDFKLEEGPPEQYYTISDDQHYDTPPNQVRYTALALVRPQTDPDPAAKMAADCLTTLGFPLVDDYASQIGSWRVFWYLDGLNGHAHTSGDQTFDVDQPTVGNNMQVVTREDLVGVTVGAADLTLDMSTEPQPNDNSVEVRGKARVRAELDQSQPPDVPAVVLKTVIGDVEPAIFDVATEWYKKWTPRKATTSFVAIYHRTPGPWQGTVKVTEKSSVNENHQDKPSSGRYPPPPNESDGTIEQTPTVTIHKTTDGTTARLESRLSSHTHTVQHSLDLNCRTSTPQYDTVTQTTDQSKALAADSKGSLDVSVDENGHYVLHFGADDATGLGHENVTFGSNVQAACPGKSSGGSSQPLAPVNQDVSERIAGTSDSRLNFGGAGFEGDIDPSHTDTISGSRTFNPPTGMNTTITVEWNLSRTAAP